MRLSAPFRFALISGLMIAIYFAKDAFGGWPYRWVGSSLEPGWPRLIAYGILYYGVWTFLIPLAAAAAVAGPRQCISALGLNGSVWTAAKIALIATAIMPLTYIFTALLRSDNVIFEIVRRAVLPGIGEEILYRSMLFGLLFRFAGWGFLPAALLGATVFGIGHLYQGNSVSSFIGVFAVTGLAALWWSWLYVEWDYNIWMPIGFHVLMNFYYEIFDVADGALGGWSFFVIRALICLMSIAFTIRYARRRGFFRITGRVWFWQGKSAAEPS